MWLERSRIVIFKAVRALTRARAGFSIVETAVALAAIAALVIVVVGGNELIKKARAGSILKDIKRFSEAVTAFESKYSGLPGDLVDIAPIPGLGSADKGNGNGKIDPAEALLFWKQLSVSNLLDGKYDGSSTYIPGLGLPKAPMEGGGYYVIDSSGDSTLSAQGIVIGLGGFSTSGTPTRTLGVLTAKAAYAIDQAMDDGKPATGKVRSSNGDGGNCIVAGNYKLDNTHADCIMSFVLRGTSLGGDPNSLSGICSQAGQTRESPDPTQRCPVGYAGKIIEACHIDSADGTGTWSVAKQLCKQVMCSGKKAYGTRRVLNCMNGQTGNGIVEECSQYGTWQEQRDLTDCTTPSGINGDLTCTTVNEARTPQACSWGRTGKVLQSCKLPNVGITNYWTTDTGGDQCALITCSGGGIIGDVRAKTDGSCGDHYLGVEGDNEQHPVSEACTMDSTWQIVANECSPQYGTCSGAADSTRDIGCPAGETGVHTQTCISNHGQDYWVTVEDSCTAITCSGEPVGSVRVLANTPCSNNREGTMMEVCHDDGKWYSTAANCTQTVCKGAGNTEGNANWPNANAGTASVTASSCTTLYRKAVYPSGSLPTRACGAGGAWGSVTNECVRITCASGVSDNAFFPATGAPTTESGPDDIAGTCVFGYTNAVGGAPTKQCSPTGTLNESGGGVWEEPKNLCVLDNFTGIPQDNLVFWFDADEAASVLKNTDCMETPAGAPQQAGNAEGVTCWYDKGPYRMSLVAPEGESPTYFTNVQNGRSALSFSGGQSMEVLTNPDIPADDGSGDTFVLVALREDIGGDAPNYIFSKIINPNVEDSLFFTNRGAASLAFERSDVQKISENEAGFDASKFYIYMVITHSDGTADWYVNGALTYTAGENRSVSTGGAGPSYTLGGRQVAGERYHGQIAENIMYQSALGSTDRTTIHNYLSTKWGIPLASTPPGEVTKGMTLWLDGQADNALYVGSDCTTVASEGTPVRCWKDKSIHRRAATDYDSDPPTYNVTDDVHYPTVRFNDNRLSLSQILDVSETNLSMFAAYVIRDNYLVSPSPLLDQTTSASGHRYMMGTTNNLLSIDSFPPNGSAGVSTTILAKEEPMIVSWHAGGGAYTMYQNGNLITPDAITSKTYSGGGTDGRVYVGGPTATPYVLDGDVGEIMLYNRKVSGTERGAIESALMTKWGLGDISSCVSDASLTVKTGLQVWYDAKDTDCDGDAGNEPTPFAELTTWKDKSTHQRDATASGGTSLYTAIGIAPGLPGIQFQDSRYTIPAFNMGGSFTLSVVFKTNEASEGYLWESDTGASGIAHPLLKSSAFDISGLLQSGGQTDGLVSGGFTTSQATIATYSYASTGTAYLYVDGTEVGTSTDTAMTADGAQAHDLGGSNYNGYIAELMAYDHVLTTEDRQTVEGYLATKWSIGLNSCTTDASLPSTTKLKLWLDATDTDCDGNAANEPLNNAQLTSWKDKKNLLDETAYNATATDPTAPIYKTNIKNGNPVIRFTGAQSQYLQTSIPDAITDPASLSFFVVFKANDATARSLIWSTHDPSPRIWTSAGTFNGGIDYSEWVLLGAESSGVATTGDFHVGTYVYTEGNGRGKVYVDGAAGSESPFSIYLGASWLDTLMIGGNGDAEPFFDGDVGEILLYGDALTNSTRQSIENYLGTKWGINIGCIPDTALTVQANLMVWLDATDTDCDGSAGNEPTNGSSLANWRDKSNHLHDVTALAPTPVYHTNIFNGKSAIAFDTNYMSGTGQNITQTGEYTIALVASIAALEPGGVDRFFNAAMGGAPYTFNMEYLGYAGIRANIGSGDSWIHFLVPPDFADIPMTPHSMNPNDPYLIVYRVNQTGYTGEVLGNGNLATGTNTTSPDTPIILTQGQAFRVGDDTTDHSFVGDIAEMLIYNESLGDTDYGTVKSYLMTKWGITGP